jgi:23S rRNA (cytidine1920-2'-O)/16S rRNA (cytidine1409-2'-O)-methyltransferase
VTSYKKRRLDQKLVAEGLAPSRARAADLIRRGCVTVSGETVLKPGALVADDDAIVVAAGAGDHVSRGALKLEAALHAFGFDPLGRVALAEGAAKVYAVDVGRGQLHDSLRADPRVVSLEATDARALDAAAIPEPVGAIVADVSFISLTQALPAALTHAAPGAWLVALVKPQFEAGRAAVGKGGIVRKAEDRERAIARVQAFLETEGWIVLGVILSPIEGGSGNAEFLIGARNAA